MYNIFMTTALELWRYQNYGWLSDLNQFRKLGSFKKKEMHAHTQPEIEFFF
jgi:hypothetical protein